MILNNISTGCLTEDPLGKDSTRDPPPCTDARKMRIEELAELAHMDRESKRLTETRTVALLGTPRNLSLRPQLSSRMASSQRLRLAVETRIPTVETSLSLTVSSQFIPMLRCAPESKDLSWWDC